MNRIPDANAPIHGKYERKAIGQWNEHIHTYYINASPNENPSKYSNIHFDPFRYLNVEWERDVLSLKENKCSK